MAALTSRVWLLVIFTIFTSPALPSDPAGEGDPTPTLWPEQFHAVLVMNITTTAKLEVIDLWYDWPNGRNFNIIRKQLGKLVYDLEWDNGTSYIYTLDENRECRTLAFDVGILRPNWLDGATYLGRREVDGFLCNVWEKVNFIWYYEDVVTRRPVHWAFYTGRSAHVMTFEVGAVLDDPNWQAPSYCFNRSSNGGHKVSEFDSARSWRGRVGSI